MLIQFKRLLRHRWLSDKLHRQIPPALLARLEQDVQRSERQHSGEIRIVVEAGLPFSYLWRAEPLAQITRARALALFGKLRVWDTENNNGVLIYLLLAERSIEVVADRGLNDKVTREAWQRLVQSMHDDFKENDFDHGLTQAVASISSLLLAHYPLAKGQRNPNELPDAPLLR